MDVGTYHVGEHPSPAYRETNNVPIIQAVLKALKGDWDRYLAKREIARQANYEDLYYTCWALMNEEDRYLPSPAARRYREYFESTVIAHVRKKIEGDLWQERLGTNDLLLCAMQYINRDRSG